MSEEPAKEDAQVNSDLSDRRSKVARALAQWREQLLDFGGRNTLINYRDLRAGTLDLDQADARAKATLAEGRAVRVSSLFPKEDLLQDSLRRVRTIRKKTVEHYEERGIETLFLGYGLATWNAGIGRPTPNAPVLLRPAILEPRGAAQDDFDLVLAGEMEISSTLLQLISRDFGVSPNPQELSVDGAVDTQKEMEEAIRWLTSEASSIPGFMIKPRMVLGNFAYMKLPMVRDLTEGEEAFAANDLIAALAGDSAAREIVIQRSKATDVSLADPNHIPPTDEFLILDADASQNYAINAVLSGRDLIVRGPPGTGKSQTIANLLAGLAARGKRALFVAEKRAAIDAVLKRIEKVGLSDLVFDLHGGVEGRRRVAQSLAASLESTRQVPSPNGEAELERLVRRRSEVVSAVEALHAIREPWGISAYQAQVGILGTPEPARSDYRLQRQVLAALDGETFEGQTENLREYVGLGGLVLKHQNRPWAEAIITSPHEAQDAILTARRIDRETLPRMTTAVSTAATETQLRLPVLIAQWADAIKLWEEIAKCLEIFSSEIFAENLPSLIQDLTPAGKGAFKRALATLTSPAYRVARRRLQSIALSTKTVRELYDTAIAARDQLNQWTYIGEDKSRPSAPSDLTSVRQAYDQFLSDISHLSKYLPHDRLIECSNSELIQMLKSLKEDRATLTKLPELHRLAQALEAAGLGELLEEMRIRQLGADLSQACFRFVWLQSLLEEVSVSDPLIGAFDGEHQTRRVAEFQELDRHHLSMAPQRVLRLWAERVVATRNQYPDQSALLLKEAAKKKRLLPFRQLYSQSKDLLLDLKPCWVMSPLVVSQVLPSERMFDVLIFDEASQIRPADAVPALARAERVVVAGDDRQLPPTAFFMTSAQDGDHDEEDETASLAATEGFESILDSIRMFLPFRMLEWHYRSQDERLIAFSNAHFYDRTLTTFPGVGRIVPVTHELVPRQPTEPGQEDSSSSEVLRVVELIVRHAESRPSETLGVIAMGIKHANRIEEALRGVLQERPDLEDYFAETRDERFFVKNLERVQGDERDAIILSVGYGKSADGRMLYRFGPLNNEGGERRLNVAVTRARKQLTLVSSFSSADMDPERLRAEGAKLLRAYLQYAESQCKNLGEHRPEHPALNAFEIDVRDTLVRSGIPVDAQLGVSGYFIDFAARHPQKRGQYILAIECDGATYHATPTARDRDRLRQEQLERLGWRFHRIWSTDWFNNKLECVARLKTAYTQATEASDRETRRSREPKPEDEAGDPGGDASAMPAITPPRGPRPPVPKGRKISEYSHSQLTTLVRWIESDTLLRTEKELLEEVMYDLGFARRGKNIVLAIANAVRAAHGQATIPTISSYKRRSPSRRRRTSTGSGYRRRRRW